MFSIGAQGYCTGSGSVPVCIGWKQSPTDLCQKATRPLIAFIVYFGAWKMAFWLQ